MNKLLVRTLMLCGIYFKLSLKERLELYRYALAELSKREV